LGRVTVIIPALNEAQNLLYMLPRLPAELCEVILVDGHSTDNTVVVAETLHPTIRVIKQNRTGKGNALACGLEQAGGDIIVTLDADGSADPDEIPRFVAALLQGADFAKGSRFIPGGGTTDMTRFRSLGNRWLNRLTNSLYGTDYTDLCYGYNAFWRGHAPVLGLDSGSETSGRSETMRWGDGFEIETLLHVRAARAGLHVVEVPSFEWARIHGRSNLHAPSDGLRVLRTILAERWSRNASSRRENPEVDHDPVIDLSTRARYEAPLASAQCPPGSEDTLIHLSTLRGRS
jgi:glycosyltransferase involved in cell wall biosynthesis